MHEELRLKCGGGGSQTFVFATIVQMLRTPTWQSVVGGESLARTGVRYILKWTLRSGIGPWMEEFKTPAPNPEIFSLCDGYSALRPAELVHKNGAFAKWRGMNVSYPSDLFQHGADSCETPSWWWTGPVIPHPPTGDDSSRSPRAQFPGCLLECHIRHNASHSLGVPKGAPDRLPFHWQGQPVCPQHWPDPPNKVL